MVARKKKTVAATTKPAKKAKPARDTKSTAETKAKSTAKADRRPSYLDFDNSKYAWKPDIDYRKHPDKYRVGKGEQGVLICQPYKSEIGAHWRFRTPDVARESSKKIYDMFQEYLNADDFVGADMARKYLQMGFTRARRYANYKGGSKYDKEHDYALKEKGTGEKLKAESADIFFKVWKHAEADERYIAMKAEWKERIG